MEKVFLIKRNVAGRPQIDIQIPPHKALIDTYLNHMYGPNTKVVLADKSKIPNKVWKMAFEDFDDAGIIQIDMSMAKKIFMLNLRHYRNRALLQLDNSYCKADDNNQKEKMAQIEVEKQNLRDLPSQFNLDAASSIADLEALWPTDLLGEFGVV